MIQNHNNVFFTYLFRKTFVFDDEELCPDFTIAMKNIGSQGRIERFLRPQEAAVREQVELLSGFVIGKLERIIKGYIQRIKFDHRIQPNRKMVLIESIELNRRELYVYPFKTDSWLSWINSMGWNKEKAGQIESFCGQIMNELNIRAGIIFNNMKHTVNNDLEETARLTSYMPEYAPCTMRANYAKPLTESNIFERVEDISKIVRTQIAKLYADFEMQIMDSHRIVHAMQKNITVFEEELGELEAFCERKLPVHFSLNIVLDDVLQEANLVGFKAYKRLLGLIFRISVD